MVGSEYATLQSSFGKSMNPQSAKIGDPIADIDTPALIVELDALNRNIAKMTGVCALNWRARASSCQDPQIDSDRASPDRVTAPLADMRQKVGEADALVRGGVNASRARRPRQVRQFERAVVDAGLKSYSGRTHAGSQGRRTNRDFG